MLPFNLQNNWIYAIFVCATCFNVSVHFIPHAPTNEQARYSGHCLATPRINCWGRGKGRGRGTLYLHYSHNPCENTSSYMESMLQNYFTNKLQNGPIISVCPGHEAWFSSTVTAALTRLLSIL